MTPEQERKLLVSLLKYHEAPPQEWRGWVMPVCWVAMVLGYIVLLTLESQDVIGILSLMLGASVMGMLAAGAFVYVTWVRQWPVFRKHLDADSLRRRLQELDS